MKLQTFRILVNIFDKPVRKGSAGLSVLAAFSLSPAEIDSKPFCDRPVDRRIGKFDYLNIKNVHFIFILYYFTKVSLFSPLSSCVIDPECGPCPDHWIHSRQKCYLFYDEPAPWKTWEQSQSFCQDRLASLVVIGDLEEQVESNASVVA
uniref:C-type lectin domain-containing protein n=1 Tax=Poecilia latipinna TaxID=48699 RepID=A0A3B3VF75_9TELE